MQEKVYKNQLKDIEELRARILTAWDKMDQCIIDEAVRQWRTRLRACINGSFRHGGLLCPGGQNYTDREKRLKINSNASS